MSQTARFTTVNGAFYPEVFTSFPDHDEAVSLVEDMVEDGAILPSEDYYEVITDWFEIGEGESGTDTFFTNDELVEFWNTGDFEKELKKKGYEVEHINDDCVIVQASEIEFEDED